MSSNNYDFRRKNNVGFWNTFGLCRIRSLEIVWCDDGWHQFEVSLLVYSKKILQNYQKKNSLSSKSIIREVQPVKKPLLLWWGFTKGKIAFLRSHNRSIENFSNYSSIWVINHIAAFEIWWATNYLPVRRVV